VRTHSKNSICREQVKHKLPPLEKQGDERSRCLDARAPIPAKALQQSLPDDTLEERHAQLQKGHKVAV
jgi:hypothetical protein